jgi:hypothetical protein
MPVVVMVVVSGIVAGSRPAVALEDGAVGAALDAALLLDEELVEGQEERRPVEGAGEERDGPRTAHRRRSYPRDEPAGDGISYTPPP